MPHYASYDIVADGNTLISHSGTSQVNFELGFDTRVDFGVRSVLSYMVDPSSSGVTFKMAVSNLTSDGGQDWVEIITSTTLNSSHKFMQQEVISRDTFKKVNVSGLGVHHLRIQVTAGAANFSDIVHLYMIST